MLLGRLKFMAASLLAGALLFASGTAEAALSGIRLPPLEPVSPHLLETYKVVPIGGGGGNRVAFALYDQDGLDTTLIENCPDSTGEGVNDMVVDGQGRVVVAGWGKVQDHFQFLVARFKNGKIDPDFGDAGFTLTNFSLGRDEAAAAVALDRNHNIVVAGGMVDGQGHLRFALARYRSGGQLDTFGTGFGGGDGKQITDFPTSSDEIITDIAVDSSNRIIAAGWAYVSGHFQIALARYNARGELDPTFGTAGRVLTNLPDTIEEGAMAVGLNAGRIVVAAQAGPLTGTRGISLVFYNAADGSYRTHIPLSISSTVLGPLSLRVNDMAIHGDRIIVAGGLDLLNSGTTQFYVGKYDANGIPDRSFNLTATTSGGFAAVDFVGSTREEAQAVAVDNRGDIVAAGWAKVSGEDRLAVARLKSDGRLDQWGYQNRGRLLTDLTATSDERLHAVHVTPDGAWILAAGLAGSLP